MAGGGDAIAVHGHTAGGGDFGTDLVLRQDAAVPGLGALAEFYLDHPDLWLSCLLGEAFRIEIALLVTAAEIAAAQFPDKVAAMFAMVGADAAFSGVMGEVAHPGATIQRADGVGAERAETHR